MLEVQIPKEWKGIWSKLDFPSQGKANLIAEVTTTKDDPQAKACISRGKKYFSKVTKVGTVSWTTKFSVVDGGAGREVDASPSRVRIVLDNKLLNSLLLSLV